MPQVTTPMIPNNVNALRTASMVVETPAEREYVRKFLYGNYYRSPKLCCYDLSPGYPICVYCGLPERVLEVGVTEERCV